MLKLTVYENDRVHSELELDQDEELIGGRSEKIDLVLSHEKVSREHFKIYYSSEQWIIEDFCSKNGTVVNGVKITEQAITNGDVITIADFRIEVHLQELKPPPDQDVTVMADEGEFGEELSSSDDRTIQDIRKFAIPPSVAEPVMEEVQETEEPAPVHEEIEAVEPMSEEPEPEEPEVQRVCKDRTEVLGESAGIVFRNSLEFTSGNMEGNGCEFDNHILVGRSMKCDMLIPDETVSREHITISLVKDKYVLTSINKNNVTYLNGKKIKKANIKDGDHIRIGETSFKVNIFTEKKESTKIAWKGIMAAVAVIVLLAASLIFFLDRQGTFEMMTVHEQTEQAEAKNEKDIIETERERQEAVKNIRIANFIKEGGEFFAKGDFSSALQRFSMVVEIDPENKEAVDYIAQCRAKIEEDKRIKKEKRIKEVRRIKEVESKRKEQEVFKQLSEADELYNEMEYVKARDMLIKAGKLSYFNARVSSMLSTVNKKIKEEELLAEVQELHTRGMESYDKGDHYPALKVFRKIVSIDIESSETIEARKLIPVIKNILDKMASQYYELGIEYYEQEDRVGALKSWQKVLDIDPDHTEAKKGISGLVLILEKKANVLYHEGLVYEGIGKIDKAVEKWKEVIETVPVKTNEYYKKAIHKIKEYGDG